jgi:hypothetical protein
MAMNVPLPVNTRVQDPDIHFKDESPAFQGEDLGGWG